MKVYHCTTSKKLSRYRITGGILPPVRYWIGEYSAKKWLKQTGREIILTFDEPTDSYPLPDMHGCAKWSPGILFCPFYCSSACRALNIFGNIFFDRHYFGDSKFIKNNSLYESRHFLLFELAELMCWFP